MIKRKEWNKLYDSMINPKEGEINIITKPSDLLAKTKVYQQKESEKLRLNGGILDDLGNYNEFEKTDPILEMPEEIWIDEDDILYNTVEDHDGTATSYTRTDTLERDYGEKQGYYYCPQCKKVENTIAIGIEGPYHTAWKGDDITYHTVTWKAGQPQNNDAGGYVPPPDELTISKPTEDRLWCPKQNKFGCRSAMVHLDHILNQDPASMRYEKSDGAKRMTIAGKERRNIPTRMGRRSDG